MSVEFCDTNVFVYAHDLGAGEKRTRAVRLIEGMWERGNGAVCVQVLQELYVTLTRTLAPPVQPAEARAIVADLASWTVFAPDGPAALAAIDASARWQLSFWDAMVITAAQQAGAETLWSEDLGQGQRFGGLTVRNPFA
jgi:predicted nucleic acid-binding protein